VQGLQVLQHCLAVRPRMVLPCQPVCRVVQVKGIVPQPPYSTRGS
jgi:hypothetical protein